MRKCSKVLWTLGSCPSCLIAILLLAPDSTHLVKNPTLRNCKPCIWLIIAKNNEKGSWVLVMPKNFLCPVLATGWWNLELAVFFLWAIKLKLPTWLECWLHLKFCSGLGPPTGQVGSLPLSYQGSRPYSLCSWAQVDPVWVASVFLLFALECFFTKLFTFLSQLSSSHFSKVNSFVSVTASFLTALVSKYSPGAVSWGHWLFSALMVSCRLFINSAILQPAPHARP